MLVTLTLLASVALAQPKAVMGCIDASEKAQALKATAGYQQARQQLLVCSRDACPPVIRADCARWLTEVDDAMPSIIIAVRDVDGRDVLEARVEIDEAALGALDGKPMPIDPGPRSIRVTAQGQTLVEHVRINAGEKNRIISFRLAAAAPPAPALPVVVAPSAWSVPVGPIVIGSLGVVSLGAFVALGATGWSQLRLLEKDPCAASRTCSRAAFEDIRTRYLAADVSLGAGVALLAIAAVWWWASPSQNAPTVGVLVGPTGGWVGLNGRW